MMMKTNTLSMEPALGDAGTSMNASIAAQLMLAGRSKAGGMGS